MTEPLVSVLIPVFNRESLVSDAIDSALSQTVANIEVVVCDNFSTDRTWDVISSIANKDLRVRVFQNSSNLGPVRNWQRCIQEARAPFSVLLFSDDVLSPGFVEETLRVMTVGEAGFVFTGANIGESPDRKEPNYIALGPSGIWRDGRFLMGHVLIKPFPYSPALAMFRTKDLKDFLVVGGPDGLAEEFLETGAGPDLLLFLEAEYRHGAVGYIPTPMVFFRDHPGSITIQNRERVAAQYVRAISWFLQRRAPHLLPLFIAGEVLRAALGRNGVKVAEVPRRLGLPPDKVFTPRLLPCALRQIWAQRWRLRPADYRLK